MNNGEPQNDESEPYGLFTVAELIRMAFSGQHSFTVNFKLIHIILLVLAKKLNILQRMVNYKTSGNELNRDNLSKMSIYETKLYARKDEKRHTSLLDFEKERIFIVYVPPEESKSLSRQSGQTSQPYTLSLTSQESYLKLMRKIEEIQKHFSLTEFDAAKRSALGISDSKVRLDIMAHRVEKTEQSINDLLGSLVIFREKSLDKELDDESMDQILKNTSHAWDLGDKVFVMRQSADVGGPFVTATPGDGENAAHQLEHQEREVQANIEDANLKPFGESDIFEGESSEISWEFEAGEGEAGEGEAGEGEAGEGGAGEGKAVEGEAQIVNKVDYSKYLYVPCHPIRMRTLRMHLFKISRDFRKEFRERLAKITNRYNKIREDYFKIKDKVLDLNVRTRIRTVQELESFILYLNEKQDSADEKIEATVIDFEQFLHEMEHDLEVGLERFHETVIGLQCDPEALESLDKAADDTRYMLEQLSVVQEKMADILFEAQQKYKILVHIVMELDKRKCTRQEFFALLENKASFCDVNQMVGYTCYAQQIGNVRKQLKIKMARCEQFKLVWERELDKVHAKFFGSSTPQQIDSFKENVCFYLRMLDEMLDPMIKLFETENPFEEVRNLSKAIQIDKACISCSSKPRNTVDKRERGAGDSKSAVCIKKVTKDGNDKKTPCYPLKSVTKKARSSICVARSNKPCEEDEDIRETLKAIIRSTPIELKEEPVEKDMQEEELQEKQFVQIPCKPCNKPKNARKSGLKSDYDCLYFAPTNKGKIRIAVDRDIVRRKQFPRE